jgi:hypothetical protein
METNGSFDGTQFYRIHGFRLTLMEQRSEQNCTSGAALEYAIEPSNGSLSVIYIFALALITGNLCIIHFVTSTHLCLNS